MNTPDNIFQFVLWLASIIGSIGTLQVALDKWIFKPRRIQRKRETDEQFDKILTIVNKNSEAIAALHKDSKRQEYITLINLYPDRAEAIERVFTEYREAGGNSYACDLHELWKAEYGLEAIKQRIPRKDNKKGI